MLARGLRRLDHGRGPAGRSRAPAAAAGRGQPAVRPLPDADRRGVPRGPRRGRLRVGPAGSPHRAVPARIAARRGRHGQRLPGAARGRPLRAGRRDQARAVRARGAARALPQRARDPRRAAASGDRATARRRRDRGRRPVPRDGVRGRRVDHRPLPRAPARRGVARAPAARRRRRAGARAPQPGRAPRPQAFEHPGGRRRASDAARLRNRQTGRRRAGGRADRADHRADDAGLRGARAVRGPADRRPHGRVPVRRAAVPAALRAPAVRRRHQ